MSSSVSFKVYGILYEDGKISTDHLFFKISEFKNGFTHNIMKFLNINHFHFKRSEPLFDLSFYKFKFTNKTNYLIPSEHTFNLHKDKTNFGYYIENIFIQCQRYESHIGEIECNCGDKTFTFKNDFVNSQLGHRKTDFKNFHIMFKTRNFDDVRYPIIDKFDNKVQLCEDIEKCINPPK